MRGKQATGIPVPSDVAATSIPAPIPSAGALIADFFVDMMVPLPEVQRAANVWPRLHKTADALAAELLAELELQGYRIVRISHVPAARPVSGFQAAVILALILAFGAAFYAAIAAGIFRALT